MANQGLGDKVEQVVKTLLPSVYEKKKGCQGCSRRKQFLNNWGGTIR